MDNNNYQFNRQLEIYSGVKKEITAQKTYRTVGVAMFCVACALVFARVIVYLLPINNDVVTDILFTLLVQGLGLVAVPFIIYKVVLKKSVREVLSFSNIKKTKWYNCALAVLLGLCVYVVTIGISSIWQNIISMLGYTHADGAPLPAVFSPLLFIVAMVCTAVFPGICEEFAMRGGFLTTMRKSFPLVTTIVIVGIAFGLFHQNITQLLYPMFFGALTGFLTLKLKSIIPAMIIHFTNNAFSVFNEYCYAYGWLNGGFTEALVWTATYKPVLILLAYVVMGALGTGIVALLIYLNSAKRLQSKKDVILNSGFNKTSGRVVLMGAEDKQMVSDLGLDKEVYGEKLKEDLYRPSLRDNAFYIGALVVTIFSTISSFIFGYIV